MTADIHTLRPLDALDESDSVLDFIRECEQEIALHAESILLSAVAYCNVYRVSRAYGGPEEGGWYFDIGEAVESIPFAGRDAYMDAVQHAEALRASHAEHGLRREDRNGGIGRYSVLGGEDLTVVVEDHPGENFPQEYPHYC